MEALTLAVKESEGIDGARRFFTFVVTCVVLAASSWGSGITGKTFALSVLVGVGVHVITLLLHGKWSQRRFAAIDRDHPSPDKGKQ
jgi:hypothetical protein